MEEPAPFPPATVVLDRCKLLTEWEHHSTMGVTFIYLGILWIAFLLKKTFPGSQVGKVEVPLSYRLTVIDHFFGVCLWATIFSTVALRILRGAFVTLFLPCHYLTCLLLMVIYSTTRDHPIFGIYQYAHWQGYYALFFADMNWYENDVEVFFFWVQHILLAAVPLYYLFVSDRFRNIPNSFLDFLSIYCWTQVYHGLVLIPFAYIFTEDLNSMLCRPVGLEVTGTWWREIISGASVFSAFLLSYVPKYFADLWYQKRKNKNS